MSFSTSIFDAFFGKKTTVRMPQANGTTKEIPVTEAWLKKMEAEGVITMSLKPPAFVPFHVIGPDGSQTYQLQVGVDIPEEQYRQFADPKTGALYGLKIYENGVANTSVIQKHLWEKTKASFESMDRASKTSSEGTTPVMKDGKPLTSDRKAGLDNIKQLFDKWQSANTQNYIQGLSDPNLQERKGCAALMRDQLIPALADDPNPKTRQISLCTVNRLISELRPPCTKEEFQDLDHAVFHFTMRQLMEQEK